MDKITPVVKLAEQINQKSLPTVNDLSLAIAEAESYFNGFLEGMSSRFGVSFEVSSKEDELKLGLYRTHIKITKINGVKLG